MQNTELLFEFCDALCSVSVTDFSGRLKPLSDLKPSEFAMTHVSEWLETRCFLSVAPSVPVVDAIWAPGTPDEKVTKDEVGTAAPAFQFPDSNRWTQTATNGAGLQLGQATTLTWAIVPDGTSIPGFNGEATAPSNLRAFLNGLYGSSANWLPVFQQVFASWSAHTGLSYAMESADDGSAFAGFDADSTRGILGVRADIRIGGHFIDGNSNILAYDFYPSGGGDMVIDTGDNFFANTLAPSSLGLRNVVAHEHGHGIGLQHVMPTDQTKLMEPFASLAFDGPQPDDILAANRGYGDRLEKNGGNDTTALATNLFSPPNGTSSFDDMSIDDDSDVDFFRFTIGSAKNLTVNLSPVGSTYLSGPQSGGSPTSFNAAAQSNLAVQVIAPDGATVLASANVNGAGLGEAINNLSLGAAGQYYIKITGSDNAAQMYKFTLNLSDAAPPTGGTISGIVYNDLNSNAVHDAGEPGLSGITVYSDADNDQVLDTTEPRAITNATGDWANTNLPAGTYKIRQVLQTGWTQTNPANGFGHNVTLASGQTNSGWSFGTHQSTQPTGGSIAGTVWNDVDGDRVKDSNEVGVANITVYSDPNNNSKLDAGEPSTKTDANGLYKLSNLPAATYKIREVLQAGWVQTTPTNNFGLNVTLTTNQNATSQNFGTRNTSSAGGKISGTIFNDLDGDGVKDSNELGVGSGWTVYIDLDNDSILDSNEVRTTTDGSGNWTLSNLAAGTYKVRQVLMSGWRQTTPSNNFGLNVTLTTNQIVGGKLFGSKKIA
jgi:hypothetical protein